MKVGSGEEPLPSQGVEVQVQSHLADHIVLGLLVTLPTLSTLRLSDAMRLLKS